MRRLLSVLLLGTLAWPSLARAEPASERGMAVAYACVTCHGHEGHSQGDIPSLSTLSAAEILAALQGFRVGTRQGTVMPRLARGLNETDLAAVATYFATLPQR